MARKKSEIKLENHIEKETDTPFPAYFLSLSVENLRCFGPRQTLDLSDGKGRPAQWTIILGDNGVGKTTLLQSIVAILPLKTVYINEKEALISSDITPRYPRKGILKYFFFDDLRISANFYTGSYLRQQRKGKRVTDFFVHRHQDGMISKSYNLEDLTLVTCFGYGASRRMGQTSLSDKANDDSTASLFSEDAALLNAEEWLLQADYAASKASSIQEQAENRRDQIKEILIKLLPDVADIRFAQLNETQMKPGIEVETPYGWVAIKDLSLGYKTLIAWMVDLASRLFEEYPDSPNPLAEPAVVLVDEIDLHLHPKWQRSLMSYLSDLFPNTQFIATAHSPLVVQAATDANIAVLRREGDHVIIDNDVEAIRGWRIDQVLTSDLFGLESARPPQFDDLLAERKKLLSKGRLTKKDKARLRELEDKIPLPAGETLEDSEAMDIIRRAAKRLNQQ